MRTAFIVFELATLSFFVYRIFDFYFYQSKLLARGKVYLFSKPKKLEDKSECFL